MPNPPRPPFVQRRASHCEGEGHVRFRLGVGVGAGLPVDSLGVVNSDSVRPNSERG